MFRKFTKLLIRDAIISLIKILPVLLLLVLAIWLFLIGFPDPKVQGTAAPIITKEEALDLMKYHGVQIVYVKDGDWVFDRNGKICQLSKKK